MASPSNFALTSKKLFEESAMVEVEVQSQKRTSSAQVLSSQKKVKGKEIQFQRPPFWLGFHALNLLAKEKDAPMEPSHSVSQLVRMGVSNEEALDWVQSEPAFPYVLQEEWPSKRTDGKEGNHYNLTQLPHELEVDEFGFALDYHVAIFFELGEMELLKDDVMEMVVARLNHMHIEVGDLLGEPIAIMCYHGSKKWSGSVKIHLKDPKTDGCGLLQGLRPFILKLDGQHIRRGKVCKSFDSIAIASLLSIRVNSEQLKGKKWYNMYEEVVTDSFERCHDFEITNIQKNEGADFAWIKAPSPDEAKRIRLLKISFSNELMDAKFASKERMSDDDKARKNAIVLIAKNLNKSKSTIALEEGIKAHMGEKNVIGVFFRLENYKHVGSCNIQCASAAVYKKYVKQNAKIFGKYVEFCPHPKSLDGVNAPTSEELTRLGFSDVNTALANTVQAMENGPSNNLSKSELNRMVEDAVNKGAVEIRKEMSLLKNEIVEEAKVYADKVQAEANKNSRAQMALLQKQLRLTLESIQADHPETLEIEGPMDMSN